MGAALYQIQDDGSEKVIAYASCGLSKSEKNYAPHKLEFLCLKWSVCEKFYDYLYGHSFEVRTDGNPLTYVMTSARLDATGHRWVALLSNFQFNIVYRSGRSNRDADALSRIKWPHSVDRKVINAVLMSHLCSPISPVETIYMSSVDQEGSDSLLLPEVICFSQHDLDELGCTCLESYTPAEIAHAQSIDPVIGPLMKYLRGHKIDDKDLNSELQQYLRQKSNLIIRDNLLFKQRQLKDKAVIHPLVLPKQYRRIALTGCHDSVGHLGRDRTVEFLRKR